jgi:hypothetical protein
MNEILEYLLRYCSFLWRRGYRLIDSWYSAEHFGDAMVAISSDSLHMKFTRERDAELYLDLQPPGSDPGKSKEWYSIDLVRRMLTGVRPASTSLDAGYAEFIRDNIGEIETRFSESAWPDTRKRLVELQRIRSKEMWG